MALLPRAAPPIEAYRATCWAASLLSSFGLRNTCLIRSLALAALLADAEAVVLHLGFEPSSSQQEILIGHAWVSVAGEIVPSPEAANVDGRACREVASISVERPR